MYNRRFYSRRDTQKTKMHDEMKNIENNWEELSLRTVSVGETTADEMR